MRPLDSRGAQWAAKVAPSPRRSMAPLESIVFGSPFSEWATFGSRRRPWRGRCPLSKNAICCPGTARSNGEHYYTRNYQTRNVVAPLPFPDRINIVIFILPSRKKALCGHIHCTASAYVQATVHRDTSVAPKNKIYIDK